MATDIRIARVFAGPGARAGDAAHRWIADSEERERIAAYLEAGAPILTTTALIADLLDPARGKAVAASYRTDGMWVWSDALMYYTREHSLAPEDDFCTHIRARRYACSRPDAAAQDAALDVLYASFRRQGSAGRT
jgi:hypothetical protein